jgi:D-alanyl-D-alanine carboxypeptidase
LTSSRRRPRPVIRTAIILIALLAAGFRIVILGGPAHLESRALSTAPSVRPVAARPSTHPTAHPSAGGGAAPTARPSPSVSIRPLPAVKVLGFSGSWLRAHPIAQAPAINGRAAIVVDVSSGQILYWLNASTRYPEASLTKMMTAMVAADIAPLEQTVGVTQGAAGMPPTRMGLSAGEQLTIRELIEGMLLDSGNDAAEALAQGIVDRDHFIALLNQKAAGMHLKDTAFANPTGLDDPAHYSSAYDLAVMLALILRDYPEIRSIMGQRSIAIGATATHKAFSPYNLDRLLWSYPGTIAGKPGYTDAAGYCLAVAATRGNRTVLAVVLGSDQHFTDGAALLDFGFAHPVVR